METTESKKPQDLFAWSRISDCVRKRDVSIAFLSNTLEIWNKLKMTSYLLSSGHHRDIRALLSRLCTESEEIELNGYESGAESGRSKPTIIFMGAINSGKSTLINTILGTRNFLPTKELPCTARITRLNYTDQKPFYQLVSSANDGTDKIIPKTRIELNKLKIDHEFVRPADLCTPTHENANIILDVFFHNEVLKSGIQIIDTPGLSEDDGLDNLVKSMVRKSTNYVTRPLVVYVIDGVRRMSLRDRGMIKWLLDELEIRVKFVFAKCDISRENVEMDSPEDYDVDAEHVRKFESLKNDLELLYKQMKDDLRYIPSEGADDLKLNESRWCSCVSALNYRRARRKIKRIDGAAMDDWFISQYDRFVGNVVEILVENISEQILCIYEDAMFFLHRCSNFSCEVDSNLAAFIRDSENMENDVRRKISEYLLIFDEASPIMLILTRSLTHLVEDSLWLLTVPHLKLLMLVLSKSDPDILEECIKRCPDLFDKDDEVLLISLYASVIDTLQGYIKRNMQIFLQSSLKRIVGSCEGSDHLPGDEFASSYGSLRKVSPLPRLQRKLLDAVWETVEKFFKKLLLSERSNAMLERVHSNAIEFKQAVGIMMRDELLNVFPEEILPELGKQLCEAFTKVLSDTHDEFSSLLLRRKDLKSASVFVLSRVLAELNEYQLVEMEVFAQAGINIIDFGDVTLGPVIQYEHRTYNITHVNSKNPLTMMAFVLQKDEVTRLAPAIDSQVSDGALDTEPTGSVPLSNSQQDATSIAFLPQSFNWRLTVGKLQKTRGLCPIEHENVMKIFTFLMPSYDVLWIVVERCQFNLAAYLSTKNPSLLTRCTIALAIAKGFGALEEAGCQFQGCSTADIWIKEMPPSGEIAHEDHIKICHLGEKKKTVDRAMSECGILSEKGLHTTGSGLTRFSSTGQSGMKLDSTSRLLGDCFCELIFDIFTSANSRQSEPTLPAVIAKILIESSGQDKIKDFSTKIRVIKDKESSETKI